MDELDKLIESKLQALFEGTPSAEDIQCDKEYYAAGARYNCERYGRGTPRDKILRLKKHICIIRGYIASEKAHYACYSRYRVKCGNNQDCLRSYDGFLAEVKEQLIGLEDDLKKLRIQLAATENIKSN